MPRQRMVLDLKEDSEHDSARATLTRAGQSWSSTGGEWLGITSGRWAEVARTTYLKDSSNQIVVPELNGCSFNLSNVGEGGRALYRHVGKAGTWRVVETS